MNFMQLKEYIADPKKMRMAHIYQPVMLKAILQSKGSVSAASIAKRFLENDLSQIEYYENITKIMPAKVLEKNGVIVRSKSGYCLSSGDHQLNDEQRKELIDLCNARIKEYISKRGRAIWQHRSQGSKVISGSIRYEVLKKAGFRCELCGVSADERALEVDHIHPKKQGGKNIIENFQALCYKCNANKRDTDSTDFRSWKDMYNNQEKDCPFCHPDKSRVVEQAELAYVLKDKFPVTTGHLLIIPKRHVQSVFDLYRPEVHACFSLINKHEKAIIKNDDMVDGFNIGANVNASGGQTVFHCHWHLIPRRSGDVPSPRGGIRHVIPGKGDYKSV